MCIRQARANISCHADSCSLSLPEAKQWYIPMVSLVSSRCTYAHESIVGVFYQEEINSNMTPKEDKIFGAFSECPLAPLESIPMYDYMTNLKVYLNLCSSAVD